MFPNHGTIRDAAGSKISRESMAVLGGDVGQRCWEFVRGMAHAHEIIHAGSINLDHVYLLPSRPPSLSVSQAVQKKKFA